jgi:hypothetical protein
MNLCQSMLACIAGMAPNPLSAIENGRSGSRILNRLWR